MKTSDELIEKFLQSDECYLRLDGDSCFKTAYVDGGKLVIVYREYNKEVEYRQCLLAYISFVCQLK